MQNFKFFFGDIVPIHVIFAGGVEHRVKFFPEVT
jgi:hypothetical protein